MSDAPSPDAPSPTAPSTAPPATSTTSPETLSAPTSAIKRAPSPIPEFPALPAAPAAHVVGHGWSASHKIPKASDYADIKKRHEEQAEDYARILEARAAAGEGELSSGSGRSSLDDKNKDGQHGRDHAHANAANTEKQRLMDQMNAGNGEYLSIASNAMAYAYVYCRWRSYRAEIRKNGSHKEDVVRF
jgi:hypothetical protein